MKTKKLSKTKINNGIFNAVIYILLLLLAVIMLYPLIFVLSASFSDPKAVAGGEMLLLPIKPSLEGYRYLMQYKEIWVGYGNTIFYMIAGTLLNLAATLPWTEVSDDVLYDYHVLRRRHDSRVFEYQEPRTAGHTRRHPDKRPGIHL